MIHVYIYIDEGSLGVLPCRLSTEGFLEIHEGVSASALFSSSRLLSFYCAWAFLRSLFSVLSGKIVPRTLGIMEGFDRIVVGLPELSEYVGEREAFDFYF